MAEGASDDRVRSSFVPPYTGAPLPQDERPCMFFQAGACRYGDKCRFYHAPSSSVQTDQLEQLPDSFSNSLYFYEDDAKPSSEPKTPSNHPPNWADAPEFVPRMPLSYASVVKSNAEPVVEQKPVLCSEYIYEGICPFGDMCGLIHGEQCEVCGLYILHPLDDTQRKEHAEVCMKEMEEDMELSFAVASSKDQSCCICLEKVLEKPLPERRFGILGNCPHVFCLGCIRTWRQQKPAEEFEEGLNAGAIRSCPICRTASDFITPSHFWVDDPEQKAKLIADYKKALSEKHCKYFRRGEGACPFGGNCFYLHALKNGKKVQLPKPERRRRQNQNGETDVMAQVELWQFLFARTEAAAAAAWVDDDGDEFFIYSGSSDES